MKKRIKKIDAKTDPYKTVIINLLIFLKYKRYTTPKKNIVNIPYVVGVCLHKKPITNSNGIKKKVIIVFFFYTHYEETKRRQNKYC